MHRLLSHSILLSPMVGLTHYAVRKALSEFLPEGVRTLWPTEMLNSRRIPQQKESQTPEVCFKDRDIGLCPQLLANEKKPIEESVRKLEDWGALAIDINMGCPVQKALKHNYGVALMGDSKYAAQVTEWTVNSTTLPVSVKMRAGFVNDNKYLMSFAQGLEDAGAKWLTIHPRTVEQKRKGEPDWELIAKLRGKIKIPIVANGDIQCTSDIKTVFEKTGCSNIMIGRALMAKPWLITGNLNQNYSNEEKVKMYQRFLLRVLELSREEYPEDLGLRKLRFLIYHGSVWLEFGHYFYSKMTSARTYEQAKETILRELSSPQRVFERTQISQ